MKHTALLIIVAIALHGCVSPYKYASFVKSYYTKTDTISRSATPAITVFSKLRPTTDSIVDVTKGPTFFISVIFYWGIKQSFYCELNPDISERAFANACYNYVDSAGLANKFRDRRLEITIDSLPHSFQYSQDSHTIFFILGYSTFGSNFIAPAIGDIVVSYTLYKDKTVVKQGSMILANKDKGYSNVLRSTKKLTKIYLSRYQQNINLIAKQCLTKIAEDM